MLARLILALLLAAFAIPSAAALPCHQTAVPATAHHMMHTQPAGTPDRIASAHVCIGCIPPSDWLGARLRPPISPSAIPAARAVTTLDLGEAVPPALPPPRMA